ncbi:MAG TPA: PilZ domain-containing protein [Candidatus Omnitrophota bacterium]|nr:PilZ domain-containing protein [Candidatus Omnitrophota bacterium]
MRKEDRRKFKRLKAYHLAKYRPLSGVKEEAAAVSVSLKDIGAGGVRLDTEEYLPVSSLIELSINFPNIPSPITAIARVVWVKKRDKGRFYEVGAQFVEIEEPVRKLIEEHLKLVDDKLSDNKKKGNIFQLLFRRG